ncbi:hypothetical protein HYDPIDRAFT_111124 [Hydnomerulius pinastri MD-312]|uniref:Uncharacterized protein n=1 Tax=Hydnomerulius pinastri MD-312 TaxID=994086 RepID=A0A0C9WB11_9AGAM|nr:hypothetical protein HYDPIDRAFT_111124 [Hydnomerulius pinastri MD-312]
MSGNHHLYASSADFSVKTRSQGTLPDVTNWCYSSGSADFRRLKLHASTRLHTHSCHVVGILPSPLRLTLPSATWKIAITAEHPDPIQTHYKVAHGSSCQPPYCGWPDRDRFCRINVIKSPSLQTNLHGGVHCQVSVPHSTSLYPIAMGS